MNIVFHGHDHLYARQDLDGIVYQEVPQPGNESNGKLPRYAEEYGYKNGTILGGSGYMRISVSPTQTTVDYISTSLPSGETVKQKTDKNCHSYVIPGEGLPARKANPAVTPAALMIFCFVRATI